MSVSPIGCEEAIRLLADHLSGELDEPVSAEVARHLELCRSCWSRAEFERELRDRVGELRREAVDAAFEQRMRMLLAAFRT